MQLCLVHIYIPPSSIQYNELKILIWAWKWKETDSDGVGMGEKAQTKHAFFIFLKQVILKTFTLLRELVTIWNYFFTISQLFHLLKCKGHKDKKFFVLFIAQFLVLRSVYNIWQNLKEYLLNEKVGQGIRLFLWKIGSTELYPTILNLQITLNTIQPFFNISRKEISNCIGSYSPV